MISLFTVGCDGLGCCVGAAVSGSSALGAQLQQSWRASSVVVARALEVRLGGSGPRA